MEGAYFWTAREGSCIARGTSALSGQDKKFSGDLQGQESRRVTLWERSLAYTVLTGAYGGLWPSARLTAGLSCKLGPAGGRGAGL